MNSTDKPNQFLTTIERHKGIIYKIAHAYCVDIEDKKDLIQEILIQLWKSFDSYNDEYQYSTWIYRIALNVSISYYRKEHRRKDISIPIGASILELSDNALMVETDPNLLVLHHFIASLKKLDKAIILLYLEEKPYQEIASIIGLTETNVATKISRIKLALKQKFNALKQH